MACELFVPDKLCIWPQNIFVLVAAQYRYSYVTWAYEHGNEFCDVTFLPDASATQLLPVKKNRWILLIYLRTIRIWETLISTYLGLSFFYALQALSGIIRLKGFYSTKWKVCVTAGLLIRDRLWLWKKRVLLLFSLSLPEQAVCGAACYFVL